MMLLNRQKQIPNGYFYYESRTKWRSRPGSFDNIVDQMIAHRQANPWLGLTIERGEVANDLDRFSSSWCAQNGWNDYISGGNPSSPLPPPPSLASRLANVAGASPVYVEWLASGAEAVPPELANRRAATCADCPENKKGDWLRFFTLPVTEAIRAALNQRREWKLETPDDYRIVVCEACDCPLRLKVHMPIDRIRKNLKPEQVARLDPRCWIPKE